MEHADRCRLLVQDENAKAGKFGFAVDNTIGGTPQENGWMNEWVAFFRERRLKPQLARTNDAQLQQMGQRLMDGLDQFFEGVEVRVCLCTHTSMAAALLPASRPAGDAGCCQAASKPALLTRFLTSC